MRILIIAIAILYLSSCSKEVVLSFENHIIDQKLVAEDESKQSYLFGKNKLLYVVVDNEVFPTNWPYKYDDLYIYLDNIHECADIIWRYEIFDQSQIVIKNTSYSIDR